MATTSNFKRTAAWLAACGKAPSALDLSCQIGVHIEEVCELLRAISFEPELHLPAVHDAIAALEVVATDLKRGVQFAGIDAEDRVEALDALCDCEVTGNGIAYLAGFVKDAADREVLRSNESKLVDGKPLLLPGGKIGKGPHYEAPQLLAFV